MNHNNPETLNYKVNDIVKWLDDDQTFHTGMIANIRYDVLDVLEDGNKLVFVPYHKVIPDDL